MIPIQNHATPYERPTRTIRTEDGRRAMDVRRMGQLRLRKKKVKQEQEEKFDTAIANFIGPTKGCRRICQYAMENLVRNGTLLLGFSTVTHWTYKW